ncbi:hypothetical protein B0H63DRAFT_385428, partial [Podospora didyma]
MQFVRSLFLWVVPQKNVACPSVGEFYCSMRLGGCWEAVGPAGDMFKSLSRDIQELLADWEAPEDGIVGWSIYMIGPTQRSARPTLLIYGQSTVSRKSVRNLIEASKILQHYPRVGLDDCCHAPDRSHVLPLE